MRRVDLAKCETNWDLLVQNAGSDSTAFARLYQMHYEMVFRYCSRRLFHRHAAEEVTSTVFFKVMKNISSFEGDSNDFRNWLYRIAINAVNDYLRTARKRATMLQEIAREHTRDRRPDSASDDKCHRDRAVKEALLHLKPKYQTVITLRFFENMKLVEIAEVLKKNPITIRSQLSRALRMLRNKVNIAAR
ncbi:MAG: sigma-70 family RNA polymerase sigma factor [Sedimentisphaerales bacterium]|nr:sigma-70 family RNA polymerase sigma factor [Sedimentisphaerales bacterium]